MEETKGERKGKESRKGTFKQKKLRWQSQFPVLGNQRRKCPYRTCPLRFGGKGKKHWEHLTISINWSTLQVRLYYWLRWLYTFQNKVTWQAFKLSIKHTLFYAESVRYLFSFRSTREVSCCVTKQKHAEKKKHQGNRVIMQGIWNRLLGVIHHPVIPFL